MKRRKVAKLMAVVALIGAVGVGGSLALLSQKSNVVTNTFAAGAGITANEDITVFEHDPYLGTEDYEGNSRDTYFDGQSTGSEEMIDVDGVSYTDLEPNSEISKDPAVQISKGTADCYLFVKIENNLVNADRENITFDGVLAPSGQTDNWKKLEGTENIWFYTTTAGETTGSVIDTKNNMFVSPKLFTTINFGMDADIYNKQLESIVVKAFAVQATENGNWDEAVALAKTPSSWT